MVCLYRQRIGARGMLGLMMWLAAGMEVGTAAPSIDTLEETVSEYVALRTALADERREWKEQEAAWRFEIDRLSAERDKLQEQIEAHAADTRRYEQEQQKLRQRRSALEDALQGLPPLLARGEGRLRDWQAWIPAELAEPLGPAFRDLPAPSPEPASRREILERLRRVLALYGEIETLQAGVHHVRERVAVAPGERREVDVFYIGLARAFAVSLDGRWAAVGTPGADGWDWTPDPAVADSARRAIAILLRDDTARFVRLPMAISSPSQADGTP